LSDALIFGLALLGFLLVVVAVLAFRFPATFEVFVGSITGVEVTMTSLKIRRAATEASRAQEGKPPPPTDVPSLTDTLRLLAAPRRVLWVDDHPEWNQHERSMLRAVGIAVDTAPSNSDAVTAAKHANPDLVISDISRDQEGPKAGLELPEDLRAAGLDVEVIYYVGRVASETTEFGAPVTAAPAELMALVAERLAPRARQRRQGSAVKQPGRRQQQV
jgi:CheY-like chemotaxis protein